MSESLSSQLSRELRELGRRIAKMELDHCAARPHSFPSLLQKEADSLPYPEAAKWIAEQGVAANVVGVCTKARRRKLTSSDTLQEVLDSPRGWLMCVALLIEAVADYQDTLEVVGPVQKRPRLEDERRKAIRAVTTLREFFGRLPIAVGSDGRDAPIDAAVTTKSFAEDQLLSNALAFLEGKIRSAQLVFQPPKGRRYPGREREVAVVQSLIASIYLAFGRSVSGLEAVFCELVRLDMEPSTLKRVRAQTLRSLRLQERNSG